MWTKVKILKNYTQMKIGLDLRFLNTRSYSLFVIELVIELIKNTPDTKYIIYTKNNGEIFHAPNSQVKLVNIKNGGIQEQIKFLQILRSDKNNLMLFFDCNKPIFYK